jgi:hypothetical protein
MEHRARSGGNDRGPGDDPPGRCLPRWDAVAQLGLCAVVAVSVTWVTGSVQDGHLAVSAVAGAAQVMPRRGCGHSTLAP